MSFDSKSFPFDGFVHSLNVIMFNCGFSELFKYQIKGFVSFWSFKPALTDNYASPGVVVETR